MPRRQMTVVQLLPALESGGVEQSTLEIAEALQRAGHRAIVVSGGGRLVPTLEATGARHVTLDIGRKSPWTLRHVVGLACHYPQWMPGVVEPHDELGVGRDSVRNRTRGLRGDHRNLRGHRVLRPRITAAFAHPVLGVHRVAEGGPGAAALALVVDAGLRVGVLTNGQHDIQTEKLRRTAKLHSRLN